MKLIEYVKPDYRRYTLSIKHFHVSNSIRLQCLSVNVISCCSHRCGLTNEDLNRRWCKPSPVLHPSIYHTKVMLTLSAIASHIPEGLVLKLINCYLGSDRVLGSRVEETATCVLRLPWAFPQEKRVLLRLCRSRELVQQRPDGARRTR